MSELKFTKGTDTEHEEELESSLISANWQNGVAIGGQKAAVEVRTCFVGNGAPIKITGKSESGRKLGKISDVIRNNIFVGELDIPEDIEKGDRVWFEFKLPKNDLSGESEEIPALPPVQVTNMKWSAEEARRGDVLKLSAETDTIPEGAEVIVTIYEYDDDGAHDRIAELSSVVREKKIELEWEYEYHEDTDEIPTDEEVRRYGGSYNPPEYFFTIKFAGVELGREQESGLLRFKDWIEIELKDPAGHPVPNAEYKITLPDGEEKNGTLDENGFAIERQIPPGRVRIEFANITPDTGGQSSNSETGEQT